MGVREYEFIVGPETSTIPTASVPTADSDAATKKYVDDNALTQDSFPLTWAIGPDPDENFTGFDGPKVASGTVTFTKVLVGISGYHGETGSSGTGTTTVRINNLSGGNITANLTGDGTEKADATTSLSLPVVAEDVLTCDITARATGLKGVLWVKLTTA